MTSAITKALVQMGSGDPSAANRLMPLVYEELRSLAQAYLRREAPEHTLQATALVHEAYLKLVHRDGAGWQGRTHFLAVGARAMRQILVDHARTKGRKKRWGDCIRLELEEGTALSTKHPESVLALDAALTKLAEKDARKAQIVELRFWSGVVTTLVLPFPKPIPPSRNHRRTTRYSASSR